MIAPIDKENLVRILEEKGRVWIIATYGMGKGLVVKWIEDEVVESGDVVVKISFTDLPIPSAEEILKIAGYTGYASWHADWRRKANDAEIKGRKLYIIVKDAQQLVQNGEKFWKIMTSLSYYHSDAVRLIITGSPSMLSIREMAIARMKRGSVLYPRLLTVDEMTAIMRMHEEKLRYRIMPYLASIKNLSGGHYGTVKYLCQLIAENSFSGKKITETQVVKWAHSRGDMDYFLQYVWSGLDQKQQGLVRRWIANRGKGIRRDEDGVRALVDVGLWYLGGRDIKWRIPWVDVFVQEYVTSQGQQQERVWGESEMKVFGDKERRLLAKLLEHRNDLVCYEKLCEAVWSDDLDLYSQWALSQLVARIRQKLVRVAPEIQIMTVRGKGWKLI